jgi:hypothetical protein
VNPYTALYKAAGRPSLRTVAEATGLAHTTVGSMLKGVHAPMLKSHTAMVDYLTEVAGSPNHPDRVKKKPGRKRK